MFATLLEHFVDTSGLARACRPAVALCTNFVRILSVSDEDARWFRRWHVVTIVCLTWVLIALTVILALLAVSPAISEISKWVRP
jgi:hypothetical protein